MSYKIRFIVRRVTETPVLVEDAPVDDLDEAVELAKERLAELRHQLNPIPNGFAIVDENGVECRKWITSA